MKKFKILLLVFLLLTTIIKLNAKEIDDDYEINWNSIVVSDKIQTYIKDKYNIVEIYEDKYPDFYGGIYLSDDAKNVIIQIVKDKIPTKENDDYELYKKIIDFDKIVIIEYVNHSFNELNAINNAVSRYMENDTKLIKGCYIDIMNNSVSIELEKISKENIDLANKLLSYENYYMSNIIKYEQYLYPKEHVNTLKSGAQIIVPIPGGYGECSTGFRTKYNNQKGYVTAGHCVKGSTNITTGSVLLSQFANNQKYDYGFVATNSNYDVINKLYKPSGEITELAVVNYSPAITVNMKIAKSGLATEYTSGKVKGLNQTANYKSGYTIKGLVKSNVENDDGDSGAPVFIPRKDSNGGPVPIGILSGGSPGVIFGIGAVMYFTSINTLPSQLQTNRY